MLQIQDEILDGVDWWYELVVSVKITKIIGTNKHLMERTLRLTQPDLSTKSIRNWRNILLMAWQRLVDCSCHFRLNFTFLLTPTDPWPQHKKSANSTTQVHRIANRYFINVRTLLRPSVLQRGPASNHLARIPRTLPSSNTPTPPRPTIPLIYQNKSIWLS